MGFTAQPPRTAATGRITNSLEDMTIFLLEASRLARRRPTRRRWSRRRSPNFLNGRDAGVGAAKQEEVRFVRLLDAIGRRPQAACTHRANQARRDDHQQLRLFALEARRTKQ